MNHGTRGQYNKGCRCDLCTTANATYSRESKRRRAVAQRELIEPLPGDNSNHGTWARYCKGCRCSRCQQAQRETKKALRTNKYISPATPVPLAPLLERIGSAVGKPVDQLQIEEIAEACRVSTRTVTRWKQSGTVKLRDIDDIAIRLGWHPAAIWGADWYIQTFNRQETA